ncbi:MAG: hypothetical protein M5U12_31745 [Verrucomicrobia bacterium]|nr:hypothetical protein [Verrucomicrobiota bacterium]
MNPPDKHLTHATAAGEAFLRLNTGVTAAALELTHGTDPSEYHDLGALTDAGGYYTVSGFGGLATVQLNVSASGFPPRHPPPLSPRLPTPHPHRGLAPVAADRISQVRPARHPPLERHQTPQEIRTMPEYLSPGVYVEEVDTGPRPIEGVSTSTAGFVGVTQRGPITGPPRLITSFAEYRRVFGGYLDATWGDARYLPHAVQGFFENGGQRLYIKRVPGTGAGPSSLNVADGIITRLREDVPAGATTARLESQRGLSNGTNVTLRETVSGVVITETRAVTSYDAATGQVTWVGGLGQPFTRTGASVQIRAPAGNTLTVSALDPGAWGRDLRVRFDPTTPAQSDMVSNVVIAIEAIAATPAFTVAGVGPRRRRDQYRSQCRPRAADRGSRCL